MLALQIDKSAHPLQIEENHIIVIGAHHMVRMNIAVEVSTLMEKL